MFSVSILPVIGGLKNVVNGSARQIIAISSIVKPILCMCMVKYGSNDDVATRKKMKTKDQNKANNNHI